MSQNYYRVVPGNERAYKDDVHPYRHVYFEIIKYFNISYLQICGIPREFCRKVS